MIGPEAVVRRAPGVRHRQLADGAGLFDPDGNACHRLNEPGELIWRLLELPMAFGQLQEQVAAAVADPPADLAASVAAFVEELAARRLVEISGAPA